MKSKIKPFLPLVVSAVLVFLIYRNICLDCVVSIWDKTPVIFLLVFLVLILIQVLVQSIRWKIIIDKNFERKISFKDSLICNYASLATNIVIPGKVGEAIKVIPNHEKGKKLKSFALLVGEKVLDVLALLCFSTLSVIYLFINKETTYPLEAALLVAFWPMFIIFFYKRDWFFEKLKQFLKRPKWLDVSIKIEPSFFFYSLILWFIQLSQYLVFFYFLEVEMSWMLLFFVVPLSIIAGAIPLTFWGAGLRDLVLLYYFSPFLEKDLIIFLGLIGITRILLPSLIGIPFFYHFMVKFGIKDKRTLVQDAV